jgi:vacuolar-type H+-ATPase subunit E/Vma4
MALEDVLKEIEERAKAQASEIEREAEKEAESRIIEAEERAKALLNRTKEDVDKHRKEDIDRTRAIEGIEKKKRILAEKRALVDGIIEKSIEELRETEEYRSFMERVAELSKGADRIVVNDKDRKFFGRNKTLETGNVKGGAVITEGELTMDYSLEGLLAESIEALEREVEEELFGDE